MADTELLKRQARAELGLQERAVESVQSGLENLKSKTGDVKAFSDEIKKMLEEATLGNVKTLDAKTQSSIADLIMGVAREIDNTNANFSKLETYNDAEKAIIQAAKDAVALTESLLQKAKDALAKKNWFNSLFVNHEANVKKAEEAFENAKKYVAEAEKLALKQREARQKNATTDDNVATLIAYSEVAVEVLGEKFNANVEKLGQLKTERVELQKNFETAEKGLKTLRSKTEAQERKIQKAQLELDELPATESSAKKGEIAAMQIELEKLRAEEREQLTAYTSHEKLTNEHLIGIKSLEMTNAVIRSMQNIIKTETASRVSSFDTALKQLQNGHILRVASVVSSSSDAMALNLAKVELNIMKAAHQEFRRQLEEQPILVGKQQVLIDEMFTVANDLNSDIANFQKSQEKLKKERPRKSDFKKDPDPSENGTGGGDNSQN